MMTNPIGAIELCCASRPAQIAPAVVAVAPVKPRGKPNPRLGPSKRPTHRRTEENRVLSVPFALVERLNGPRLNGPRLNGVPLPRSPAVVGPRRGR
jgi:hypothetical protein